MGGQLALELEWFKFKRRFFEMKNVFYVVSKLVAVLLLGITVAGCVSTQYSVDIRNVGNSISEVYIRNAGTTNWGTNLAGTLRNIDRSIFSDKVDIRVVDALGLVYSKYNVPFSKADFEVTGKNYSLNTPGLLLLLLGLGGLGYLIGHAGEIK